MNSPWTPVCLTRLSLITTGLLLSSAPSAHACGPDFPNTYFAASDAEILAAPEGIFAQEIDRLPPPAVTLPQAVPASKIGQESLDTLLQDVADVRLALDALKLSASRAKELGDAYQKARLRLSPAPDGLPAEFARYYLGALAWHDGRLDDARAAWLSVLALPEPERRFRSVWATYMLGRLAQRTADPSPYPGDQPATLEKTSTWFAQTRTLAARGFPDPLGLAAASYGWEAQAAVTSGDYAKGLSLYRLQLATGDADSAMISLRWTAKRAIETDDATLSALAHDELSRRILTAYFVSLGGLGDLWDGYRATLPEKAANWAKILARTGLHDLPDTDRLAWVAYEGGLFALAEQWVALAPAESPTAEWIRAKLALRKGDLATGEAHLRHALTLLGPDDDHLPRLYAELGRVCLSENKPVPSLEAWMAGGQWEDAAYVAEHVLTLDELRTYVDVHCSSARRSADYNGWYKAETDNLLLRLRHLLARRLVRANNLDETAPYFPEDLRPSYASYVDDTRAGYDLQHSDAERAAAFWRAAQTIHDHGMDLLGTELEPDWAIWGGDFSLSATTTARRDLANLTGSLFAPTKDELTRLDHTPPPAKRFHYRYRAAELAWAAASLLPNDSDETARILDTAGRWLAARDPQFADRFYQALVIRCPRTALGRAAAAKHWFPLAAPTPGNTSS